jgi:TPR repeat protein
VRLALLLALVACHPQPAATTAQQPAAQGSAVGPGCPDIPACTAEANQALSDNDIKKALEALNRGCVFGDAHSCAVEGNYLATNPQQTGDVQRANVLFAQACDNNDGLGCEKLAMVSDDAKAAQLYDKACNLGNQNACGKLAFRMHSGKGTSVDNARAVQLAQHACQAGAGIGCAAWGRALSEGWNGTVDKDQAKVLFTKSCDMNDGHGCADLAAVTSDPTEASRLRAKACAQGYHEACPSGQ